MEIALSLLFFFSFVFVGVLISGSVLGGFVVSMLLSLLAALISAMLNVYTNVGLSETFLALAASQLMIFGLPETRAKFMRAVSKGIGRKSDFSAGSVLLFSLLAFFAAAPPLAWDARSIWLSKASWLNGPANQYLFAQQDGLSAHPEYPLTGPSSIAMVWSLLGVKEDLQLGVAVNSVIPIALLGAAVIVIVAFVPRIGESLSLQGLMILPLIALFSVSSGLIVQGLMDVSLAAAASALAMLLAFRHQIPFFRWVPVVASVVLLGSNLKQEGSVFIILVLASFLIVSLVGAREKLLDARVFGLLFAVWSVDRFAWYLFSTYAGLPSSVSTTGIVSNSFELLDTDSPFYGYAGTILDHPKFSWLIVMTFSTLLIAPIIARLRPRGAGPASKLDLNPILIAICLILGTLFLTYSLGGDRDSLDWWLATSLERIASTPLMLIITFLALSAVSVGSGPGSLKSGSKKEETRPIDRSPKAKS